LDAPWKDASHSPRKDASFAPAGRIKVVDAADFATAQRGVISRIDIARAMFFTARHVNRLAGVCAGSPLNDSSF
jgi:hypothetical protein